MAIRLRCKPVHIYIHPAFYRQIENSRKEYSKKIGVDLSYQTFTELVAKSNLKFPEPKSKPIKQRGRRNAR